MTIFMTDEELNLLAAKTLQKIFRTPPSNTEAQVQHIRNCLEENQKKIANDILCVCRNTGCPADCPVQKEGFSEML